MKRDKDDNIDESSINELIQYSEDEGSSYGDMPEEGDDAANPETQKIPEIENSGNSENEEAFEEVSNETFNKTFNEESENSPPDVENDNYFEYEADTDFSIDNEKKSHKGLIIGISVVAVAVLLFIGVDTGVLKKYAENFAANFSELFPSSKTEENIIVPTVAPEAEYNTDVEKSIIISLEEANQTEFLPFNGGIICASANHLMFIDGDGNVAWEKDTAVVSPILKAEGDYILLAEDGGKKLCLYKNDKLVYDVDDSDTIVTAELSSDGDVVAVTNRTQYKGGISVYNKSGEQIYSWASGRDMITCADISPSSRRVAVALLNTEGTAKTTVQLFNVNESESYSKTEIENTVIFDMRFTDDVAEAFGDNRIVGISENGAIIYNNVFDDISLTHFAIDKKGNKILSAENGNIPVINVYDNDGDFNKSIVLSGITDFLDIYDDKVIYNIERNIYFWEVDSDITTKYTATMDVKKLFIISDNSFAVVYSNSLEIVTV